MDYAEKYLKYKNKYFDLLNQSGGSKAKNLEKELLEEKKYDTVVFHYPCNDGLASGWIANMYYKNHNNILTLIKVYQYYLNQ